jgi:protein TonB
MTGKEGLSSGSDSQENYEAAVLDFLDKEIADVQPNQPEAKQSEELDAIVADLLKQVITESDRPSPDTHVEPENLSDLLSEFPSPQEPPPIHENAGAHRVPEYNLSKAGHPVAEMDTKRESSVRSESADSKGSESYYSTPAIFKPSPAGRRRMPMIAAAVAGLVVIAAVAFYLFKAYPNRALKTEHLQPVAPVVAEVRQKTEESLVTVQPPAGKDSPKAVALDSARKSPVTVESKPAPATVPKKSPAIAQPTTVAPAAANKPIIPQPSEAKPPAPQAASPAPTAAANPIAEKPAPPPAPENNHPPAAAVEKKTVPPVAATPEPAESSAPSPVAAPPVAPRILVPAVAISQVSPKYPEFALRTRSSGQVILELDVDSQGIVTKATPVSGPEMFYREAINAAMKWRYKPASIGGTSVSSQVKATFNFNLKP